jgi:hypothetical protein
MIRYDMKGESSEPLSDNKYHAKTIKVGTLFTLDWVSITINPTGAKFFLCNKILDIGFSCQIYGLFGTTEFGELK